MTESTTQPIFIRPSNAAMWMNCGKALRANVGVVDRSDPGARNLGTALHHFRERILTEGCEAIDLVGQSVVVNGDEFDFTDEHAYSMQPGIDRLRAFGGQLFVEAEVDLSPWLGEGKKGKTDAGIILPDLFVINDYKSGFDPVSIEGNEQLMWYAIAFYFTFGQFHSQAKEFLLMIDQPNNYSRGLSEWTVTLDELLEFAERGRMAALRTVDPDAPGTPGIKTCKWCLAKARCGELAAFNLNLLGITPEQFESYLEAWMDDLIGGCSVLPMPNVHDLTPERRVFIIDHASMFQQWIEAVKQQTLFDAIEGRDVPGKKAVIGREGNRKWDVAAIPQIEEFVDEWLDKDDAYNTKLKSPAQLEKVVGKKTWPVLARHIVRAEGKPILVDENDPRPGLAPLIDRLEDPDDDDPMDLV